MQEIDEIIERFILDLDYKPAADMFANINQGKRLRSKLILKIAGENNGAFLLCAIVELIHLASLLHDDVIDESDTRRGVASINAKFGAKNAIMLGDILYSKAFFEISKFDAKIAEIISEAVCKLSIGELMDVELGLNFNSDKEMYLQMIYNKTAVLIEAASRSAAILGGLESKKYAQYGKNLGIAFQIVDDILDITGDQTQLGKPAMQDFKEGKTTLPYILLYENLPDNEKIILKNLFKKDLSEFELSWLKDKFKENDIIAKTSAIIDDYGQKAIEAVSNSDLIEIVQSMINRDF